MSTKASYDPAEWSQLLLSASLAGIAVTAAAPSGPIGVIKELFAAGKVLAEIKTKGSGNELLNAIVADLETSEGRAAARDGLDADFKGGSAAEIKARAIAALKQAAAIVDAKGSPGEAADFRGWLYHVSQQVAEAAKEGGFLGFGGVRVSPEEAAALQDIRVALDLPAAGTASV
jgi:hypothetical protein